MISARDIYKIQKNLKEINAVLASNPPAAELLTSEWGILGGTAPIQEVSFLKSDAENLKTYKGYAGQVVYNTDTKMLHMMNGETPGGIPMNSLPTTTSTFKKDILTSEWAFNNQSNKYELTVSHNLNISIEDLDLKFYVSNRFTLIDYFYVDRNTIKILSESNHNSTVIIRKN